MRPAAMSPACGFSLVDNIAALERTSDELSTSNTENTDEKLELQLRVEEPKELFVRLPFSSSSSKAQGYVAGGIIRVVSNRLEESDNEDTETANELVWLRQPNVYLENLLEERDKALKEVAKESNSLNRDNMKINKLKKYSESLLGQLAN